MNPLFQEELQVVNVGLPAFAEAIGRRAARPCRSNGRRPARAIRKPRASSRA